MGADRVVSMSKTDVIKSDGTVDYRARRKGKPQDLRYARKCWSKRDDESRADFGKFIRLRDIDPEERDFEAYLEKYEYDRVEIDALFEKYEWQHRIDAWDSSTKKRLLSMQARALKKMNASHATAGSLMVATAMTHTQKWLNRPPDEEPMSVTSIVTLARAGTEIERVSRDMPTAITEVRERGDISKLDTDDLRKLKEIRRKAKEVEGD
jgi:hypothetical protein